MTALSLKDIRFGYDENDLILDGVNIEIPEGAVVSLRGRSGCGKTTLAMIACGVIPKAVPGYLVGSVTVFGEDISGKAIFETADMISMVFQDPESQLFAPTVEDETAFAPENLCFPSDEINRKVDDALKAVGMCDFRTSPPGKLSGGQQQLAALASILSLDPKIIILDEPASQLDEEGVGLIREAIRNIKAQGRTVVVIDHDRKFEMLYGVELELKDGRVYPVTRDE